MTQITSHPLTAENNGYLFSKFGGTMNRYTAREIAEALGGNRRGIGWMALCPAHDDKNPSLSIKDAEDGKVLFFCFAGCAQSSVLEALKARDLWHQRGDK
jgi:hypothetical protein